MKKLVVLLLLIPFFLSCGNDDDPEKQEPVEDHPIVGIWQSLTNDDYFRFTKGEKFFSCDRYGIEVIVYYADYTLERCVYTVKNDRIHIVKTIRFKESGLVDNISVYSKYEILNNHPEDTSIKGTFLVTENDIENDRKGTFYYKKVE